MKLRLILVALLFTSLGVLAGQGLNNKSAVLKGRLSACKDITSVINSWSGLGLECVVADGDVWITAPLNDNEQVSLDGKRVRGN